MDIEVRPVDAGRWPDMTALFGPSGAYSGCWCMWWRIPGGQFGRNGNAGNRAALRAVVTGGEPVGLLAYRAGEPVGWCALAPRPAYTRVLRSPALRPPADPAEPGVWSVPCFFIGRGHRRSGVATTLLAAAVTHPASQGADAVEGYPVDPQAGRPLQAAELYSGTVDLFRRAGFTELRRPPTGRRIVMHRTLEN